MIPPTNVPHTWALATLFLAVIVAGSFAGCVGDSGDGVGPPAASAVPEPAPEDPRIEPGSMEPSNATGGSGNVASGPGNVSAPVDPAMEPRLVTSTYLFEATTPAVEMWSSIWAEHHDFVITPNTTRIHLQLNWTGLADLDPAVHAKHPREGGLVGIASQFVEYQTEPVLERAPWIYRNANGTFGQPDHGATLDLIMADIDRHRAACDTDFDARGKCMWSAAAYVEGGSSVAYVLTVRVTDLVQGPV